MSVVWMYFCIALFFATLLVSVLFLEKKQLNESFEDLKNEDSDLETINSELNHLRNNYEMLLGIYDKHFDRVSITDLKMTKLEKKVDLHNENLNIFLKDVYDSITNINKKIAEVEINALKRKKNVDRLFRLYVFRNSKYLSATEEEEEFYLI